MLKIVKYIKENGLENAINDFKLKFKDYGSKFILTFNTFDSDLSKDEVKECRGLILEKDTYKVMAMPFYKFFNINEPNAVKINLEESIVLEKIDGSMVSLYFDWNKNTWFASTKMMAEGEGEVNNITNTTFGELFFRTLSKNNIELSKFKVGFTYVFELCTPENIVICKHENYTATLLMVRDNELLTEFRRDELVAVSEYLNVPLVKSFDLKHMDIQKTFDEMPYYEEGYVLIDKEFNRVKIKNPAYVAISLTRSKTGFHHILNVVKENEVDEYVSIFTDYRDRVYMLQDNYNFLILLLDSIWTNELRDYTPNNSGCSGADYANRVFSVSNANNVGWASNLFFGLNNGKIKSVKEFIYEYDNKKLYKILNDYNKVTTN